MERFIAEANIARFEQLLSRETDPEERLILETLLVDERAKLQATEAHPQPVQPIPSRPRTTHASR